jgi:hypothetical protein
MRAIIIIGTMAAAFAGGSAGSYLANVNYKPATVKNITTPDPHITNLEARVSTLEKWAQRRGMKY